MRRGPVASLLLTCLIAAVGLSYATSSPSVATDATTAAVDAFGVGRNIEGQLADAQINLAIPHAVATVSAVTYSHITVGADHACGLTPAGHAYCWGSNYWGQLGNSSIPRLETRWWAPTLVMAPDGVTWSALSAGLNYTCGVAGTGSGYCWGQGEYSKLGLQTSPFLQDTPAVVRNGYRWRSITAGSDTTCGVTVGGAALCWGFTRTWSGSWSGSSSSVPTTVSATGGLAVGSVRDIAVGASHSCAVTTSGRAYCWGDNTSGRLGLGNTTNQNAPQPVVPVAGLGIASTSAVVVAPWGSCALSTERIVFCWGYNNDGQLGNGTTTQQTSPHPVTTSSGLPQGFVRQLVPSSFGACAVDVTNDVWCWGQGSSGRLGDGRNEPRLVPARTVRVPSGVTVSSVALSAVSVSPPATGPWTGCFLSTEGQAWCWRTGDPFPLATSLEPAPPSPMTAPPGRAWTQMVAGWSHTCALDTTGAVWCWGDNEFGQLGTGDTLDSPDPQRVNGLSDVAMISAAAATTCAVTVAGTALCWGPNWSGELGTGDTTERRSPTPVSVSALPVQTFTTIAASQDHACAIDAQSVLWCWGANQSGQLGTGDQQQRLSPTRVVVNPGPTPLFATVSAGAAHTCAIEVQGQRPWCWGSNLFGQVGIGYTSSWVEPVRVHTEAFTSVSPANDHTCGLAASRVAYCWGFNASGQLGAGDTATRDTPTAVPGLTGLAVVATGTNRACAASTAGEAWCWGQGLYGALGDAGVVDRTSPTLVVTTSGLNHRTVTGFALGDGHSWFLTEAVPAPPSPALTPTFDAPVATATGFTVNVTNFDPAFTWTPTVTTGTVVTGSAVGSLWTVTVSGLTPGASATLTVTTTRTGYTTGTATTTGTAQTGRTPTSNTDLSAGLAPLITTPVSPSTSVPAPPPSAPPMTAPPTTAPDPVDMSTDLTKAPSPEVIRALPEQRLVAQLALEPGVTVAVAIPGFTPNEPVQLIVASTPRIIATGRADSTGTARLSGTIPVDLPPGDHTIAAYAPTSGVGVRQTFTATSARLPATGSQPDTRTALTLLVLGLAIQTIRRGTRSRSADQMIAGR